MRIIEIISDTVFYRSYFNPSDSLRHAIPLSSVFMIKYETGLKQVISATGTTASKKDTFSYVSPSAAPINTNMYNNGYMDAHRFYHNKSHFWGGFAGGIGCGGLCTGIAIAATPPKANRLMVHDKRMALNTVPGWRTSFNDHKYVEGYRKGAHKEKIEEVAKGYGVGFGVVTATYIIIVVASVILSL